MYQFARRPIIVRIRVSPWAYRSVGTSVRGHIGLWAFWGVPFGCSNDVLLRGEKYKKTQKKGGNAKKKTVDGIGEMCFEKCSNVYETDTNRSLQVQ